MSDAEWDADGFDPENISARLKSDKWDGEDEEEDPKDSWDKDDEEDENDDPEKASLKAVQRKKKKKLADIIAEKEAAKLAEYEAKTKNSTPEAIAKEKLRQLKIEEASNNKLLKDMMGEKTGSIDSMVPVDTEDFEQFEKALTEKITMFASSDHYNDFIERFVKSLCLDLNATTLKKIKMNAEALHSVKLKEEKNAKSKKGKAAKGIKMDLDKDLYGGDTGGYDDMDDFM